MATDLTQLLEVNQLVSPLLRGDLTAAEALAEKARLLATIAEETSVDSDHLPSPARNLPPPRRV